MATVKVSSELLDKFKSHIDADAVGSPDSTTLSPALVLAVALLYMMAADGQIEEAESSQLQSVVGSNDELLGSALAYVQAVSIEAFLEKAPEVLSQQDKQCILVNVFDSLLADGHADPEELALFGQMRNAFGVTEAAFKNPARVITLKNDKSVFGPFKALQSDDLRVTPHLAMAASLLYMMSSDGSIGPEEIGQLEAVIGEFEGLQAVALRYVRAVKREDFFIAIRKALTVPQKLCILTNVCDSMMSDGTVAVVEDKLFVSMLNAFGLKLNDFDKYYQVLEAKNIRPFDTNKFKRSTKHDRVAGEAAQDGEVFDMTGAASELGIEVRRTMHDNIDRVQHDFGSEENILEVNHNAIDDLNIQKVTASNGDLNVQQVSTDALDTNLQQVSIDALGTNLQQVSTDALGTNLQQVSTDALGTNLQQVSTDALGTNLQQVSTDAIGTNLQQVSTDAIGTNLQQVSTDALGTNLQQVSGEQANGNSAQWIAGAAPVANRQALGTSADFADSQRLGPDLQSANVQSIDEAGASLNRQALQAGASDGNRALIDAKKDADHLETLPPEERVKNLFQDIESLSRQLDEFESKNKAMLNAARRAREQEEVNQQALIHQQLADDAIALAQASSAQALGMPKAHLQSNLQGLGTQDLQSQLQPIDAQLPPGVNRAQIAKEPITDKVVGSAQSQSSQDLGVPKAHVQTNVQDLTIEGVKINRQLIDVDAGKPDSVLQGGVSAPANSSAAAVDTLSLNTSLNDSSAVVSGDARDSTIISTSQEQAFSAAPSASGRTQTLLGVQGILARSTHVRYNFKMYVKLTLTFFVLSFWTSNIAAIYPVKPRAVAGHLVRIQHLISEAESSLDASEPLALSQR